MGRKVANPNAKQALNAMKLEIANELGISSNHSDGGSHSAHENGVLGGKVGGMMSKRLIEMGQEELIRQYNSKNK
ncbi:MAG: small, acid-soluble spore protein, alpha/beta type [Romboutsia sp.]|uniref:small, acid-soluble spore protein, alpha/beta type n=1 Tax=Romboutsia sp. TaxID=1965302 RepID=UPI003F38F9DB